MTITHLIIPFIILIPHKNETVLEINHIPDILIFQNPLKNMGVMIF